MAFSRVLLGGSFLAGESVLRSATVGALPLVNRLVDRTRLEASLRDALPKEDGEVIDQYSTSDQPNAGVEGYRLVWYHSRRKAEQDAVARATRTQWALKELASLREKLHSPRTRCLSH